METRRKTGKATNNIKLEFAKNKKETVKITRFPDGIMKKNEHIKSQQQLYHTENCRDIAKIASFPDGNVE